MGYPNQRDYPAPSPDAVLRHLEQAITAAGVGNLTASIAEPGQDWVVSLGQTGVFISPSEMANPNRGIAGRGPEKVPALYVFAMAADPGDRENPPDEYDVEIALLPAWDITGACIAAISAAVADRIRCAAEAEAEAQALTERQQAGEQCQVLLGQTKTPEPGR